MSREFWAVATCRTSLFTTSRRWDHRNGGWLSGSRGYEMPLYLNQSVSSRLKRPVESSCSLKRTSSATSTSLANKRSKIGSRQTSRTPDAADELSTDDEIEDQNDVLGAAGKVITTLGVPTVNNVLAALRYAPISAFSALPERAGMNSVRIAEVLNFQKRMPPLVSLAQIHALMSASSRTERELQSLQASGSVLRLRITGRGNDLQGLSEILILMSEYERLLKDAGIDDFTSSAFLALLKQTPHARTVRAGDLPASGISSLTGHGFLVSSSLQGQRSMSLSGSELTAIPKISRAASGSLDATGGGAALEHLGGIGGPKRSNSEPQTTSGSSRLTLSVPNMGAYLKLLEAGRSHLLALLQISKHRQAPMSLLRERWDGAVDSDSRSSLAKQLRGEFSTVLPAKTKKWKRLHGLNFDWAVAECLGAGLVEVFETHAVGLGIRALT